VLLSSFPSNTFAQTTDSTKNEQPAKTCTSEKFVMPETISVGNDTFADYLKVALLPRGERQKTFGKLSNEQKASFVKVQLALQFVKRPNLTKQQRDFIFDSMSRVSVDLYDRGNPQKVASAVALNQETEAKAFGLFAQKDAFEILEGLGADKDEDVALLQKYEDLLKNGTKMRKKIAKEMPVNDRVNVWKVQLAYHLTTGKFSRVQNEFILDMLTSLSPDTFTSRASLTKEEQIKVTEILDGKILSVFSKAEAYAIFQELGIQKIVSDTNATNSLRDEFIPADSPFAECNCVWFCGLRGGSCSLDCRVQVQECGTFGGSWCTGRCPN